MDVDADWCNSLVGRDWEIFWENEDDNNANDKAAQLSVNQVVSAYQKEMNIGKSEESDENDEEAFEADWYDGRVLSFRPESKGTLFQIQFVGDKIVEQMYLRPSIVRPSARAWLTRSKAILSGKRDATAHWHRSLPIDTATLDDGEPLTNLERSICTESLLGSELTLQNGATSFTTSDVKLPKRQQIFEIQRLRYLLQSQIYLRSKLARIVDMGEKTEEEPTEGYCNHIVKCLEELERVCSWFENGWRLHRRFFLPGSQHASETPQVLEIDRLRDESVNAGLDVIVDLLSMDTTLEGMKKKRRAPATAVAGAGSRRTKRKRIHRDLSRAGFDDNDCEDIDEGLYVSVKSIKKLSIRTKQEQLWFTRHFFDMLKSTTYNIQEPVRVWKCKSRAVLGDRAEFKDDEEESSGKTSIEEKDESKAMDSISSISDEERVKMYTYSDVAELRDQHRTSVVLNGFNLGDLRDRLNGKLLTIEQFEERSWDLLKNLVNEPRSPDKQQDEVLAGLNALKAMIEGKNAVLFNIDPLGKSNSSRMNATVIENSIATRDWILDLVQGEKSRERVAFIQNVVTRAANLPHIPAPPDDTTASFAQGLAQITSRVQGVSAKLYSHVHIVSKYERIMGESQNRGSSELETLDAIEKVIRVLQPIPVLSLVEEKLRVRIDVLKWVESCHSCFSGAGNRIRYDALQEFHQKLSDVMNGESENRLSVINGLCRDDSIEKQIRAFAADDFSQFSGSNGKKVVNSYQQATQWKERASAIIDALAFHGNKIAKDKGSGEVLKGSAMVDIKRIHDLVSEYATLPVEMATEFELLVALQNEATAWSSSVDEVVTSGKDLLEKLSDLQRRRPNGMMMEPARMHLELVIELLEWRKLVKGCFSTLSSTSSSTIFALLHEGIEIVSQYSQVESSPTKFSFEPDQIIPLLGEYLPQGRQSKSISVAKLATSGIGDSVYNLITTKPYDESDGCPLLHLLYTAWSVVTTKLSQEVERVGSGERPALEKGVQLLRQKPSLSVNSLSVLQSLDNRIMVGSNRLHEMVLEATDVETRAKQLSQMDRETLRGVHSRPDELRSLLSKLKALQAEFKLRSQKGPGLVLNKTLEHSLDQASKDVSWLVKTLSYPLLHSSGLDEPNQGHQLPWDVLVTLHQQIQQVDISRPNLGDIPVVALRVKELHDAAKGWQDAVSNVMNLSIRGVKRRTTATTEVDQDSESQPKVSNAILANLAKDPILTRVSMPREDSVRRVLQKAEEFENLMFLLLGKDFEGIAADNAPYPQSSSMVGEDGEFLLYRLTGSPLYDAFEHYIEQLSSTSSEVLADTPGKAAFEWLKQVYDWIEIIQEAVSSNDVFDSVKRLSIPISTAREVIGVGNQLFLDMSDDIRKALSNHKIILTTNKQAERVTAVIGKLGAHHSPGATVIKWCPMLMEWLKGDFSRLSTWLEQVQINSKSLNNEAPNMDKKGIPPMSDIRSIHRHFEVFEELLLEGRDLVVVPEPSLVKALTVTQQKLMEWMKWKLSTGGASTTLTELKKQKFTNGKDLIKDREVILECLLARKEFANDNGIKRALPDKIDAVSVRDKARSFLEKALRKGVEMMGMRSFRKQAMSLHVALKVFELENAVHTAFPLHLRRDDYRDKIRSLRSNIEDLKNPTLGPRILCNDLSVDRLIKMSSDELAGRELRQQRAQALEQRKKSIILGGAAARSPVSSRGKSVKHILGIAEKASQKPPNREDELKPESKQKALSPTTAKSKIAVLGASPTTAKRLGASPVAKAALKSPPLALPPAPLESDHPSASPRSLAKATTTLTVPPSLSAPSLVSFSTPAPASLKDERLTSQSGDGEFTITITKPIKVTFQAEFYIEEPGSGGFHGFLPERLTLKGRLNIGEYVKWMAQKLSRGTYHTAVFRVSARQDVAAFKQYYKSFEADKRVAYFDIGRDSHMMLVTPKFHKSSRELRDRFKSKTSTYAVIQTKEKLFFS